MNTPKNGEQAMCTISVRISVETKNAIVALARKARRKPSEYVRLVLEDLTNTADKGD